MRPGCCVALADSRFDARIQCIARRIVFLASTALAGLTDAALAQSLFTEEAKKRGVNYFVTQGAFGGAGQF